jgi:hypothetical protein
MTEKVDESLDLKDTVFEGEGIARVNKSDDSLSLLLRLLRMATMTVLLESWLGQSKDQLH